jgi:hypothetical protein
MQALIPTFSTLSLDLTHFRSAPTYYTLPLTAALPPFISASVSHVYTIKDAEEEEEEQARRR